ncbi:MAG: hypothetical protein A2806_02325 [Candidatus Terrybacteria bacterium RIFCSPHIGHO2_01_FULL_48_17]|uniref:STAS/SEC14 domain-containing protein n=1 Tax=Candidatus Terrybacteria bacterium RIFCSPHIGHO2_01_FULL_48_17 TaxID=1802362 RepID=A0A1G2PHM8_9BACT|nr:MAG: hypothetical protein A2806_02325 [Candidatus Terrybacteria bacterium RIFCSPHIGHO2_01_FULL_48_17]OHA53579.1 MAG: hypothetical protein A3A30_00280 [Candidatus Terrybacteria bacterium RIFCSPLOWO2_01_FULL_48_14]
MPKSDQELKQYYQAFLDNNGLIHVVFAVPAKDSQDNMRKAELIEHDILALYKTHPGKRFRMLVDLVPLGENHFIPEGAREVYFRIASNPQLEKMAVVGLNPHLKGTIQFLAQVSSGEGRIQWFEDEVKALEWLMA